MATMHAETLSHTAVLQASAADLWQACRDLHRIVCDLLPDYYIKAELSQGIIKVELSPIHGKLGLNRLFTTGPAIKHMHERLLMKRMDKFHDATKTHGNTVPWRNWQYHSTFSAVIQFVAKGLTVLGDDSRCAAFVAEIEFVEKHAAVTEATWTASFLPKGDMGPPEHINALAKVVFQTLEKAAHIHSKNTVRHVRKTFAHMETLDVSPDALWNAYKHVDEILLEQMPQHFESFTMVEGHGGPGTVRVVKFGPAVQFAKRVTEHTDFIEPKEKRMGYSVLEGDPRYKYFATTMHFSPGPSTDSTTALWVATYVPEGDMGPPEHIGDLVTSVWRTLAAATKVNPERYA